MKKLSILHLLAFLLLPVPSSAQYVEDTLCQTALKNLHSKSIPYTSISAAQKYCHTWILKDAARDLWKEYSDSYPAIAAKLAEETGKEKSFTDKLRKKMLSGKTFCVEIQILHDPRSGSTTSTSEIKKRFWKYHVRQIQHYGGQVIKNLPRNRFLYRVSLTWNSNLAVQSSSSRLLELSPCPITEMSITVIDTKYQRQIAEWNHKETSQHCKVYENFSPLYQKIYEY